MAANAARILHARVDQAPCLSFDGPAGRTELIRGRRRAGLSETCTADHAILACFGDRGVGAPHRAAFGPHSSGPLPHRHVTVLPARHRPVCWDLGSEQLEGLAVFLPPRVVDECSDPRGRPVMLSARAGIADDEVWATLCKIKRAVEQPHSLRPSYHGQLLRLLAAELAAGSAPRPASEHGPGHGTVAPPGAAARGGMSARHARLIKAHLSEHFARAVPLAELAALVQLSRSHLCEAFRDSTGLTPHQFQLARRIDRAKELLAEAHLPLAEVALAVGYGDQSQFGALFLKAAGSSPGRYRRQALARDAEAGMRAGNPTFQPNPAELNRRQRGEAAS